MSPQGCFTALIGMLGLLTIYLWLIVYITCPGWHCGYYASIGG